LNVLLFDEKQYILPSALDLEDQAITVKTNEAQKDVLPPFMKFYPQNNTYLIFPISEDQPKKYMIQV